LLAIGAPTYAAEDRDQTMWFETSLVKRWQANKDNARVMPLFSDALGRNILMVIFAVATSRHPGLAFGDYQTMPAVTNFACAPETLDRAYQSAGYARFEHGETPSGRYDPVD